LPFVVARIKFRNRYLALLGVHIPPPTKRCIENRRPTLNYFASLVEHGRLRKDIGPARTGDEVIILGDFNIISFETALDPLNQAGLEDVYDRHHWRPGPTWSQPAWFPAVFRIDFIFISRHLETTGVWATHIKGSDHRGVIADISLR
jgi:endonuclease/exonuclease/phosphatase family metal-dependent hydrolase